LLLLGVGFSSFALFMGAATSAVSTPSRAGARPAGNAASAPDLSRQRWMSRHDPVFTRGTGQWMNIVGLADVGLSMVDGATGQFVWHVPAPSGTEVYTDGVDRILAYDGYRRVSRHDAKSGKLLWTITVADSLHEITFGSGCASLRFGKPLGIDTETGQLKDCAPTRPALLRAEWDQRRDFAARRGDVDFSGTIQLDDKPINAEPPRIAVKASRAGRELWRTVVTTLEPVWTSDGFVRSVALGATRLEHRRHRAQLRLRRQGRRRRPVDRRRRPASLRHLQRPFARLCSDGQAGLAHRGALRAPRPALKCCRGSLCGAVGIPRR
jgi:hypothetical protein